MHSLAWFGEISSRFSARWKFSTHGRERAPTMARICKNPKWISKVFPYVANWLVQTWALFQNKSRIQEYMLSRSRPSSLQRKPSRYSLKVSTWPTTTLFEYVLCWGFNPSIMTLMTIEHFVTFAISSRVHSHGQLVRNDAAIVDRIVGIQRHAG